MLIVMYVLKIVLHGSNINLIVDGILDCLFATG